MRKTKQRRKSRAQKSRRTNRDNQRIHPRVLNEEHFGARILDWDDLISADGRHKRIKVNTRFGFFLFDYDRDELQTQVARFLKNEMNSL